MSKMVPGMAGVTLYVWVVIVKETKCSWSCTHLPLSQPAPLMFAACKKIPMSVTNLRLEMFGLERPWYLNQRVMSFHMIYFLKKRVICKQYHPILFTRRIRGQRGAFAAYPKNAALSNQGRWPALEYPIKKMFPVHADNSDLHLTRVWLSVRPLFLMCFA